MAKSKVVTKPAAAPPPPAEPERYVCIHGHFYQPPRENPWLETVEVQDSAAPYHDWNDRITAECYAPNGASRISDRENKIIRIMNNYSRMSFNFGPTLLSWLCDFAPRAYRMILDADRTSAERHGGHGSAIAQVYNHIIMPLANERDALTQIRWGIADFEFRFGRKPEGMWLAETAVSRKVLDLMAQEGIKFTILAPHQCARVRRIASPANASAPSAADSPPAAAATTPDPATDWVGTPDSSVNTTHPYRVELDEGRSIAVFFYDGPASRSIAFEGLLNSGESFGQRLLSVFPTPSAEHPEEALLSHVATDGESYGHHHRHGEMALSYAMHWLEDNGHAKLTNYGEFLAKFPPRWAAEVVDDTAWSCSHGVERWRSDCGCNSGRPGWNQLWREPLRGALDMLRDVTAELSEKLASTILKDVWVARDAYVSVILDRQSSINKFLAEHQSHELSETERIAALELMELQRHTQLMYTSCGWFFDEVSGIETVQVIAYAGRVLQLAAKLFGESGATLEAKFLEMLDKAPSNVPDLGSAAEVYRRYVTGMKIGLEEVGAHYAISSIFRPYPEDGEIFCYNVHRVSHEVYSSGRGRIAIGGARIFSRITEETEQICFAVLHLGDQNISAAVRRYDPGNQQQVDAFKRLSKDIAQAMRRANLPEVIRLIDQFFHAPEAAHDTESAPAPTSYSLTSLFADEQHRIVQIILNQTVTEMEESLRKIYNDHASLLDFLTDTGITPPPALEVAANFAINASLRRAIEADPFDPEYVLSVVERANIDHIELNLQELSFIGGQRMKKAMVRLEAAAAGDPQGNGALAHALAMAETFRKVPFEVNLWGAQNIWNDLLRRSDRTYWTTEWREDFRALGEALNIKVDQLVTEEGVSAF
jgi:alpha-amylase/alpha-mannosidase (GH57 family)